ncbi:MULTISPECIES: collagen-like protein [Bacillus]|uniref:collagen-like protein n=1 Tax=Bacillus TaxID=1386 RepID=UPI00119F353D|nr:MULTISPECIES: collagen-like protein [Bacillus]MCP1149441.1 collagen-like protein [Bacillus sp. 1735sda2]MCP1150244.1 collagen-like protein [Bacillus sp. 1735sda2]
MAKDYLNESNGVYTSAEAGADGKPITAVTVKDNSEENPLYVKGLKGDPGEQGPKGDKGDPAVIETGSIKNDHLGDGSVNSRTIGKGSVKWDNINSEVQKRITDLESRLDQIEGKENTE